MGDQLGEFLEDSPPLDSTVIGADAAQFIGTEIGPYQVLEQIGEGGFGVVFVAEQSRPIRRRVALKIVKPGMDTKECLARFEAERQALALMDHPNIARVFDAGATRSGLPYFVMELVHGIPITQFCDANRLSPRERLQIFVTVCRAVQHAHQKGVIHRDIKPSNVLVAELDGQPVVKVIDFGIAKALSQPLTERTIFTNLAQMIGTPLYMSPEQAEMSGLDVDTRSDVYSLGVLLYELLTGVTPFDRARFHRAAVEEIRKIIREEEPKKPSTRIRTLNKEELSTVSQRRCVEPNKLPSLLRGELDWVVMKALEKSRSRRYDTAGNFAADIERFLSNEPVEASPPSSLYRFRKLVARHKFAAALAAVGMLAVLTALAGLSISNRLISEEQERTKTALEQSEIQEVKATQNARVADEQRAIAQAQRDETVKQLYVANMQIANQEWKDKRAARAREILASYLPERHQGPDLRGWEWNYLWRLSHSELRVIETPSSQLSLAFTPDGQTLVTGGEEGTLRFWSGDGERELRAIRAHHGRIQKLFMSPDGKSLLTSSNDGTVKLWDVASAVELHTFPGHKNGDYGITYSPDSTKIVIAFNQIVIFDASAGTEVRRLNGHDRPVTQVAFFDQGRRLISSGGDLSTRIWNVETGEELANLNLGGRVAACPTTNLLAEGQYNGQVKFIRPETLTEFDTVQAHDGAVTWIAFNSDGTRMVTAGSDTTVLVWDTASRRPIHTFFGHTSDLTQVEFVPHSDRVASCGWDSSVRIWDPSSRQELPQWRVPWFVYQCRFSPDGQRLAILGRKYLDSLGGAMLAVYDEPEGDECWKLVGESRTFGESSIDRQTDERALDIDPTSRLVATQRFGSDEGIVELRELETGKLVRSIPAHQQPLSHIKFFPDGRLASASIDGEVAFWSAGDFREFSRFRGSDAEITGVAISPDSQWIVLGSPKGTVRDIELRDGRTGEVVKTLHGSEDSPHCLDFSGDGRYLFTGGRDQRIQCWDLSAGTLKYTRDAHSSTVMSLDIAPDGRRLASSSGDRTVKIWDADSGFELLTLRPGLSRMYSVVFSPDGSRLAAGTGGGGRTVWDSRFLTSSLRKAEATVASARLVFESLLDQYVLEEEVRSRIPTLTDVTSDVRARILILAERHVSTPEEYQSRSREIALQPKLSAERYSLAVQGAERAVASQPEDGLNLNTLGIALYRAGRFADAIDALTRSAAIHAKSAELGGPLPSDLTFMAMAHYQLGQREKAIQTLEQLRLRANSARYRNNPQVLQYVEEADGLISPPSDAPVVAPRPVREVC